MEWENRPAVNPEPNMLNWDASVWQTHCRGLALFYWWIDYELETHRVSSTLGKVNILTASPRTCTCAILSITFPSLFAPTEILTGECCIARLSDLG